MPELPEVETMCRGIADVVGRTIEAVETPPCACRPCTIEPTVEKMHQHLVGRSVRAIERRGKRVMLRFDDDERLVIEPRMSGLVLLADPPSVDHLRLRIRFSGRDSSADAKATSKSKRRAATKKPDADGIELLVWDRRGLGTIRLLSQSEFAEQIDSRLGVDALQIDVAGLRRKLDASSRAIKVALLDQTVVAGIGNLYAAEILFVAGVDPRLPCNKLSGPQWTRLHAAISHVLDDAIVHEGSTLSDGTYRNVLNDPGGYQNMHRVYDRKGQYCQRCTKGVINRIVQAQRSTFFCPVCQKRSGKHASV
ncbi:formamidopyrimidine-DNA glycosylase [Neorhodopirellula lusitana]|uniref:Formamidopyrimidine-DNA glycosylase n=1 Tax=Neorhodopirellula lusitana TaxID=445327 RepID=A0ABY1QMZ1_9BACT|nr:bifunctional DNA-formamidopyrimidine glycosylase/DNA-(apurinic or apyrimidinic site) lyase [Neorhodopirellula lusitana]SMP73978.1 formamidopyrimidine-DNA glycosylase [Neorhodopirellula lusitana]